MHRSSDNIRAEKSLPRPKTSHGHTLTSRGFKEVVAGLHILNVRVVFLFIIRNTGVQNNALIFVDKSIHYT